VNVNDLSGQYLILY